MKKIYSFLSLCLLFLGLTTATAQTAELKLTFDRTGDNVSVSVAGLDGVTASVVSKSHDWKDLGVANANTVLCPNVNGNTDPTITWGIQLNGVPANYKLKGMALDIHALNGAGQYQDPADNVNRHWNVAVAQGETPVANFADIEISQGTEEGRTMGNNHKVHSVAAAEALAATDPMTLNFTVTKGSVNLGCFFGLSEVTLTYEVEEVVEPEPEVPATPVVITEVAQLSNAKCYTLVSADTGRGGMYALADKVDMCGVTYNQAQTCHGVARDNADPKQQFAFVEYEGKHYLYSVSEKKFVMKSGDTNALVGEAPFEFVTVEKVGENTFALKANDTHYFTASPGWCANPSRATCVQSTTSQSEGDGWDAGAWFTITEAGEFNPEEALAMLTPAAPATPLEFVKANPVLESEVTSLSSITLTFNKEIASVDTTPGMFWFVNADVTNMYDAEVQINATDAKTITITLAEEIKESGTYIALFYPGALVAADGTSNQGIVELAWIVKAAPAVEALQLVSIDPAAGSKLSSVIKFTLTYNKPVTLKNEEGATLHANGGSTTLQVLVSETDAKEVVLAADKEITNSGSYELKLAAGTLEDADGGLNEALTFNYEVESANNTLNVVKTDPDVNVPQDSLKRVVLTFNAEVMDCKWQEKINVTDESGAVVATGRMDFTEVWEEVLISFNKEISTPGKYTVTVPENTIFGNGTYNPEINLTYTIVADYVFLTDGEAYTNATEKETERITYTREFNNTQWQSWYVPFDMDYNDISDEYTAACLNDIHEYDDDEDGVLDRWTMEVLILRPGETIYANLPYVIRAKAVGEKQFVVENTMLYPADEQSMDCSSMRMHYTFTGTYSPIEAQVLRDNGWLAMGNGRLVTPTTTSTLKANRWYLESTPRKGYGSTYQAPKRIELVVVDENGEVTGVEELPLTEDENAVWPADVYDLNGRLVKAQAKNLEDLPKGVYVVNGQKWVK